MSAVVFEQFGGPETLTLKKVPVPSPRAGEVLVRVGLVSVNKTLDISTRSGRSVFSRVISPPHILGADAVGVISGVGEHVPDLAIGARVGVFPVVTCGQCRSCSLGSTEACASMELVGIHRQGCYAEYVVAPAENVCPLPSDVTDEEACKLILVGSLAHRQISVANVQAGAWMLVTGANGSLGRSLLSMGEYLGMRVIGGVRGPARIDQLRASGYKVCDVVDITGPAWQQTIMEMTDGEGVEAIFDNIGIPGLWSGGVTILRAGGTIVSSGALGHGALPLDLRSMYLRNHSYKGVRTSRRQDVTHVLDQVRHGLRAPTGAEDRFSLSDAPKAHRYVESGTPNGRVLLRVP